MAKDVKYLQQVVGHLEKEYGSEITQTIIEKARARYNEIIEENKDEPKEYYMHTRHRIYPAIALFDAMTTSGIERGEAADFLNEYYRQRASDLVPMIKAIFKIPGLYKIMPKVFFNMAQKNFGPKAGFQSENRHLDKSGMQFDMVVCPYYEKCAHYGCPEIVAGFCDADDVCYGEMHPKLIWGRTKTIGHGAGCCDFKLQIKGR